MTNPRKLAAEHARHDATAFDWAESESAKALITRYFEIEDAFNRVARLMLIDSQESLFNDLLSVECELDACRDDRIADEIAGLSEADQDDDYLCDEIEQSAPKVSDVLAIARKIERFVARIAA